MNTKLQMLGLCMLAFAGMTLAQTNVTNGNDGTINTVPVYTGTSTLGNSPITVSGGNVGIGTTSPSGHGSGAGTILDIANTGTAASGIWEGTAATTVDYGVGEVGGYSSGLSASDKRIAGIFFNIGTTGSTNPSGYMDFETADGSPMASRMRITASGNVGIGTTAPGASLEVNGNVKLTANSGASITFQDGTAQTTAWTGTVCGGDYAEAVDVSGALKHYGPGDVLVFASGDTGEVEKSSESYSSMVTGVYATKPGVVGRRETLSKSAQEIPMAMVGIVPTKVSAENGSIRRGDLLVTSSKPGYAMKGTDRSRMLGAIIGKAMGSLESGTGVIEVVVTLQ